MLSARFLRVKFAALSDLLLALGVGWGGVPTLIPVVAPEIGKYT